MITMTFAFCKEFLNCLIHNVTPSGDIPVASVLAKLFLKSGKASLVSGAYHRYTLNYINALNYLETLRRQNEFNEFEKGKNAVSCSYMAVVWCSKDRRCKKLQLTDLLVAPVQHITKLPLILKEVEAGSEDPFEKQQVALILEKQEASLPALVIRIAINWASNATIDRSASRGFGARKSESLNLQGAVSGLALLLLHGLALLLLRRLALLLLRRLVIIIKRNEFLCLPIPGELDDKMKWLKNFERLLEIQRNIIWPTIMEMEPRCYVPDFLKQGSCAKQPCERLIVSPRRQIMQEGILSLLDTGRPIDMYVILFDDMLVITKRKKQLQKKKSSLSENWGVTSSSKQSSGGEYVVYKQPLSLDRFVLHDVPETELHNALSIVSLNRFQQVIAVHTLQANSEQLKVS
ncbi:unnamed protein product [Cyprideis torosa]|uniref:Uncharacterized protein n=1 Tax=Cyprideis torosa TaxID=163714 RepID=A0A7R8WFJ3_9CRUS|nr:unnamed protein product [Cyprideis torosa]CAG0896927.1 unnamed protein product [Cyprideis torosa]